MALRRRVADVFWAFMYWYFFGGGAGGINAGVLTPAAVEELSDRVAIVIEDPARAGAEVEAALDQLNRDWERGQERVLDLRFELREQLTREEWAALYAEE
jgi:hypothetical protein